MKKLLYVCEADSGGIVEYAIQQSAAIARGGVEVYFLCKSSFSTERLGIGIISENFAPENPPSWAVGKFGTIWRLTCGQRRNAKKVVELATSLTQPISSRNQLPAIRYRPGSAEVAVIFACYKEYFAPFWVGPLRKLAHRGVVIGTVAHDPVRDFVVGPLWWHRLSVRLGYSFVRHVFVHDDTPLYFGGKRPDKIQVRQIPHGPYEVAEPKIGRLEMRKRLGLSSGLTTELTENTEREARETWPRLCPQAGPALARIPPGGMGSDGGNQFADSAEGAKALDARRSSLDSTSPLALNVERSTLDTSAPADVVFLAFGQIRDGKNLDLFLRAMTQLPENVKLLVAGKGDSGSSRPAEYYQKLAEELGVAERCRWDIRRIPEDEVGDVFAASDVVLLTYSAKFRSASGVLNAAVSARKPILASSGQGPLKTVVEKYHLGVFVAPDDLGEILKGASKLVPSSATGKCEFELQPEWERYERENSWEENAKKVRKAFES